MRNKGLTLIELVVVLLILSLIFALGIIGISGARQDAIFRASINYFIALLCHARDSACANNLPAVVEINIKENSFRMRQMKTVAFWDFENISSRNVKGAFRIDAKIKKATQVQGRVGMGVKLGKGATITCESLPEIKKNYDVVIQFYLYPVNLGRKERVFSLGDFIKMRINKDRTVSVKVCKTVFSSTPVKLTPKTWLQVGIFVSGNVANLYLNGECVKKAKIKGKRESVSKLVIGKLNQGFSGMIDEFKIGVGVPAEKYTIPSEVKISISASPMVKGKIFRIYFDEEGRLNPDMHKSDIKITFKFPSRTSEILISTSGEIKK